MSDPVVQSSAHLLCTREAVVLQAGGGEVIRRWEAPHGSELPAETWIEAVHACRAEATDRGLLRDITTMTLSGDLGVHVMAEADGTPLRDVFCGADERMAPDASWLLSQLPGAGDDWKRITGGLPHSGQLVARCSWLHRSDPELWARVGRICSLPEWVAGRLVSHPVPITADMAAASGFWSSVDAAYSRLICAIIDADQTLESALGQVDPVAGGVVGTWEGLDLRWA